MNKEKLKIQLEQRGIPSYAFNLSGDGKKDDRFCIENREGKWSVYYLERGIKTTNELFESEEDACQFLYDQLID